MLSFGFIHLNWSLLFPRSLPAVSSNLSDHLEHVLSFLRSEIFFFCRPLLIATASKTRSINLAASRNSFFSLVRFYLLLPGHSFSSIIIDFSALFRVSQYFPEL